MGSISLYIYKQAMQIQSGVDKIDDVPCAEIFVVERKYKRPFYLITAVVKRKTGDLVLVNSFTYLHPYLTILPILNRDALMTFC
jgi:hypothetical protein